MLSVLHVEWLIFLVCSILLILVGCTVVPKPHLSESSTAEASLTFAIVPFTTVTPQANSTRPAMTMTNNINSDQLTHPYVSATPPPVTVEVPDCFDSVNGGLSCFGKLWNRGENAIGGAVIKVEIVDNRNKILAEETLSLEQKIIPSDSFASYRVLFAPLNHEKASIRPTIMQELPTMPTVASLRIIDERGLMMDSGRYRLTATIENELNETIHNIRFFATLLNQEHEIVGYRIYEVDGVMQPTERKAVDFEVIPQVYVSQISHVLHVEGQIEQTSDTSTQQALDNVQP